MPSAGPTPTARRVGAALSAAVRSGEAPPVVLAGCHHALVGAGGLAPDWVFEAASATLLTFGPPPPAPSPEAPPPLPVEGGTARLAAPAVRLELTACARSRWRRFRAYHYKTPKLSAVSTAYALDAVLPPAWAAPTAVAPRWADEEEGGGEAAGPRLPVGFVATIPHSGKRSEGAVAPARRAHRTVVLPEWQGVGIGSRLSDAVAELHRRSGADYYGQTVHPTFGGYRDRSSLWRPTEFNHQRPELRIEGWRARIEGVAVRIRRPRLVYSHFYVGAADEATEAELRRRCSFE